MSDFISIEALTRELERHGHLREGSTTKLPQGSDRPWFISVVLGFSGWLAGLFALGFVAQLFKPETPVAIALCGSILIAAAFGLYAADRHSEFFNQLALALSIAGQFALMWAAADATESLAATAALIALLQVILLIAMPNDLAKLLAAFFSCCAWALAIRFAWWGESDSNAVRSVDLTSALIAWVVVWAPILGTIHALVSQESVWMSGPFRRIARAAISGLLVALCVGTLLSEPLTSLMFWDRADTHTNWLVLWPLLGAGTALVAAVYAYKLRNRPIIGVAAAGALLHIAQFYYLLGTTLLIKSAVMIGAGVIALLVATWLRGQRESNTKASPEQRRRAAS